MEQAYLKIENRPRFSEWGNHNFLEIQVEFDHMPNMNRNGYDHRRYDYPVM